MKRMKAEETAREVQKERRGEFSLKMMKDSQHEVLLPAGQVAPDSNGCALHILYLQRHISVELLCWRERDEERDETPQHENMIKIKMSYSFHPWLRHVIRPHSASTSMSHNSEPLPTVWSFYFQDARSYLGVHPAWLSSLWKHREGQSHTQERHLFSLLNTPASSFLAFTQWTGKRKGCWWSIKMQSVNLDKTHRILICGNYFKKTL